MGFFKIIKSINREIIQIIQVNNILKLWYLFLILTFCFLGVELKSLSSSKDSSLTFILSNISPRIFSFLTNLFSSFLVDFFFFLLLFILLYCIHLKYDISVNLCAFFTYNFLISEGNLLYNLFNSLSLYFYLKIIILL